MESTKKTSFRAFLDKKGVTLNPKLYFVDAMSSMAMGLFATLLMGTIFGTIAGYIPAGNVFSDFFLNLKTYAQGATGIVLGIAVACALKAPPLVLFSAGVVGMCGNALGTTVAGVAAPVSAGPLGAFICVLIAVEVGKLVSKATKVDIIVTPATTIGTGVLVAMLVCPGVAYLMYWLGYFINLTTNLYPFFMGIIISVVVGIVLTLPISSAALCAMIGISGLAGGAAVAGCCAQMVGFAVISFRENRWSGIVAQGLGTSMLQMGNICRKPVIWLPPTLAAAVCGPLSTMIFRLECVGVSAGMGTCGLVGPIGIIAATEHTPMMWIGILTLCIIAPAVLSLIFNELMRKCGWIKTGDMALTLN